MSFPEPPVLQPAPLRGGPPPRLPERWRAVALMIPYQGGAADGPPDERGQIYAAEITYDWSVQAMRVRAHGVEGRPVDLLYVGDEYYVLDNVDPRPLRVYGPLPTETPVPGPDWLTRRHLTCQGRGTLSGVECDWWLGYTPNANGLMDGDGSGKSGGSDIEVCNWIWVRADTGLPFRLFFNNADNPYKLPVIGGYAMTYFTEFDAVEKTDLPALVEWCRREAADISGAGVAEPAPARGLEEIHDAMRAAVPNHMEGAPEDGAARLVKGLRRAPPDAPRPQWSPRLCITGRTFPTARPKGFDAGALPMRVFYDAPDGRMLTRASIEVDRFDGATVEDMILHDGITHLVLRHPDGSHVCAGVKHVGPPYMNWGARDMGLPKAVIEDNPVLCPGRKLHVTALGSSADRWFWVWYTPDNDGVLFMEVPQKGNVGLVITDYETFDHDPPPFPEDAFDVPQDCLDKARREAAEEAGEGAGQ
ncbi:MAG: hypothetical protein GVY27_06215 [Deinococcus-Thermus bacterium]|jgi:hypothetical protein|nr:hypothetical protein [Deinococcota bacterium]